MGDRVWPVEEIQLREAGQGLEEWRNEEVVQLGKWFAVCTGALGMAVGLSVAHFIPATVPVWLQIGLCYVAVAMAIVFGMMPHAGRIERIVVGRRAEKLVGQALRALESDGGRIVHDIRGPIGNIDHVLIHRSGIYAVETKHKSRIKGRWTHMRFADGKLTVNGSQLKFDPIPQAKRQAGWLYGHMTKDLGLTLKHPVKAVVLYPGWHVESDRKEGPLQVASPKLFVSEVTRSRSRELSDKQVSYFFDLLAKAQSVSTSEG